MALRKYPKKGTVGNFILEIITKDPNIKYIDIQPKVAKAFPKSKFNKYHLAWYKHQLKSGKYIGTRGF